MADPRNQCVRYPSNIPVLTSLRFVAAFCIVIRHTRDLFPSQHSTFECLELGVDCFFILSGFILCHAHGSMGLGKDARYNFYVKRLARIYPVHVFTLFIGLGIYCLYVALGFRHKFALLQILYTVVMYLCLVQAVSLYPDPARLNSPSWSISAEWFAYLLFPFFAHLMARCRMAPGVVLGMVICIFAMFWIACQLLAGRELTSLGYDFGVFRIMPEFVLGIALYHVGRHWRMPIDARAGFWVNASFIILALIASFPKYVTVMALGSLILMAAEMAKQERNNILSGPVAVYLGEISYSMYMIHAVLITLLFTPVEALHATVQHKQIILVIFFPVLVAASALCHHLIERPARRFICGRMLKPEETGLASLSCKM
jgi:peptidoglycan/LPS O-acetylase OafA/YrhL